MRFPTVDDIKLILGITDDEKDDFIQMQLDVVLAMIENYCDRHFALGDYEDLFLPIDARNPYLLLRARPVESITEILRNDTTVDPGQYHLVKEKGMVRQANGCMCWLESHCGAPHEDLLVKYRGGWDEDEWPADFIDITLQIFCTRWNATGGSYAASSGGGTGEIKSFTVGQVKIDYDVGSAKSSIASSASGNVPPEIAPYAALLEKYSDRRAYGV